METIFNSLLETGGPLSVTLGACIILVRHILNRSEQREERLTEALDKNTASLLQVQTEGTQAITENTEVLRNAMDTISGLSQAITYCEKQNAQERKAG